MKKIISIGMAISLFLSILTGCASEKSTTDPAQESSVSMKPTGETSKTSVSESSILETVLPSDHVHEYTETLTREATCGEKGIKTFTCTCGECYTEQIDTIDHRLEKGVCIGCGTKTVDVLKGKSAIFLGDSIVMAQGRDEVHPWWGYAGRINNDYALGKYKNVSNDGASISDCWAPNTVVNQLLDNKRCPKYHFVVLEGGTNDAWTSTALGKMSDIAPEDVTADTFKNARNTFCAGLEDTLYYAKSIYPNATFLYVITPKMNRTEGKLQEMQLYVDATLEICEKWGIPCLNFYNMDESFYGNDMTAYFTDYVPDGVHPNSAGYDKMAPYVADAMAECFLNK